MPKQNQTVKNILRNVLTSLKNFVHCKENIFLQIKNDDNLFIHSLLAEMYNKTCEC